VIYFLQPVVGGPIKVGFTDNLGRRLVELEAQYNQPLAVLFTMEGDREREAEIHERFSHLRFGRTEQFKPAADLMAFIGRPLLVSPNPDAVEVMPGHLKPIVVQLRGSEAWKSWLEKLARFDNRSTSNLFERAVHRYAKEVGFPDEPPER
jgi:hypothetical protein